MRWVSPDFAIWRILEKSKTQQKEKRKRKKRSVPQAIGCWCDLCFVRRYWRRNRMSAKLLRDGDTVAQWGIYTQEISQGFCTYLKSLIGSFFLFLWRRESVLNTKHKERVFCWDKRIMAVNPQLYGNGTPVPFVNEVFLLRRESVEFLVDKLPG